MAAWLVILSEGCRSEESTRSDFCVVQSFPSRAAAQPDQLAFHRGTPSLAQNFFATNEKGQPAGLPSLPRFSRRV
jgi:hypothetical protein